MGLTNAAITHGTASRKSYTGSWGTAMAEMITNPYVEVRNGGYYLAGSRVSLASVIHAFRQGSSPETILQDFPYIGSLAKVYGAITFILENPTIIESYLAHQERLWNELEHKYPLPPEMLGRFEERA